jgi:hypothetical protein
VTVNEPTAVDRIPIGHSVNYAVRGLPEIADEYNAERTIDPIEITLAYRAAPDSHLGRISAYVKGWWMQDGKRVPMDKPVGRWLYGDTEAWPEWLAEEARLHDPDAAAPAGPAPATEGDAEAEPPLSPFYEHPECGFHWHGRDGMDIPMRDGEPVCPRCELRSVEKRLAHFERRCIELREESLRRGKNVLEHSEKNRALEREIDGVRRQLGAEILRANHAEAELRRLAGEAQAVACPHGCDTTHCPCLACEADQPAREARQDPAQNGTCGAREPEPRTGTSPCVLPAGHGGTRHRDKWTNQWPIDLVAGSGQPETEARCPEAVWTPTPHPPHTWNQSPTHPQRPCPGVPEADGQPETE